MARHGFRITVLVENRVLSDNLVGEHGLSFFIEGPNTTGMFDTGQTDAVVKNAAELGKDLSRLDWIVLSHGHYDHAGGLEAVLALASNALVYAHPDAVRPKYARGEDGAMRYIGVPLTLPMALQWSPWTRFVAKPVRLAEGISTTGPVPRVSPFEQTNPKFCVKELFGTTGSPYMTDEFQDDQAIILECEKGPVVLLGCAHAGVVNTIQHAAAHAGTDSLHAVIGGMHLRNASEERIQHTIDALKALSVANVGVAHCTGSAAEARMTSAFGEACFPCPAGTVFEC